MSESGSESTGVSGFAESTASYEELSTSELIEDGILPHRLEEPFEALLRTGPAATLPRSVRRVMIQCGPLKLDCERSFELMVRHGPPSLGHDELTFRWG